MSNFQLPNGPKTHPWIQTYQWLQDPLGYPVFTFSLLFLSRLLFLLLFLSDLCFYSQFLLFGNS